MVVIVYIVVMKMVKKKFIVWSDKHKRCLKRIKAGIARHKNEILRFLTLSVSPKSKKGLLPAFHDLHRRIGRLTVNSLIRDGYLSKRQAGYFYGKDKNGSWSVDFRLAYLGVKTGEGVGGVYHVLFYGQYVPESWLYDCWMDILGVPYLAHQSVDIRMCKNETYDVARLSCYCVNQYVANQDLYERFNCSSNWVYRGFAGDYDYISLEYWRNGCIDARCRNWRVDGYFIFTFDYVWNNNVGEKCLPQYYLYEFGDGVCCSKGVARIKTDKISCENCLFLDNVCFIDYVGSRNERCVYGKECIDELLPLRWLFE